MLIFPFFFSSQHLKLPKRSRKLYAIHTVSKTEQLDERFPHYGRRGNRDVYLIGSPKWAKRLRPHYNSVVLNSQQIRIPGTVITRIVGFIMRPDRPVDVSV